MLIICEYCDKPVDNRSLVHKSQACQVARSTSSKQKYQCSHCGKCLSSPTCLRSHRGTCIKRLETDITDLQQAIVSQAFAKDKVIASLEAEIISLKARVADLVWEKKEQ